MNEVSARMTRSAWNGVYKIGGLAILIAIPVYVLDIVISLTVEGADLPPDAFTAVNLFALYRENWLLGFRALGLINIVILVVSLPFFVALYGAHRETYGAYAALALIVWLAGATIYLANNVALPMSVLSGKYAAAATDGQRTLMAAAGEAMLARGAEFSPGSFVGLILTNTAAIGFSLITLRSRVFGRAVAYTGLAGFVLLAAFTVCSTFFPSLFAVGMAVAAVGGVAGMIWYIYIAFRLLGLGRRQATI